ncbi:MAG: hybrid sensor histidine kinase/response regulator [Gemmatimonadota bacterium]|nr:MAG: hybrid sensor histidine kinase/response regulator [Gemmatimonadota bacterium]
MKDPLRILVVDDDRLIREFFDDILIDRPCEIDTFGSGQEALDAIASTPYHLVVTDLKMPEIDGHDILRTVQEDSPDTVVIIMTGRGTIEETVDLMKEGAFDVVTKPFSIEEMRMVMEKALKHQEICSHNEELKARLATSEKLAVIGRLAAGVAHELNNPLDGVLRFVNLSIDRTPVENDVNDYLTEARTGLNRMADIVKSLLKFSRNIVIENEPRRIDEMIREALSQVQHANQRGSVEVSCDYQEDDLLAPAGMYQVFTNLIKNAFDAMADVDPGKLTIHAGRQDDVTIVEIRDNGCGIPDADAKKVFEPFYTTKEIGKGTGLGLSICARIMEKFNGSLSIDSTPGVGTALIARFQSVEHAGSNAPTQPSS